MGVMLSPLYFYIVFSYLFVFTSQAASHHPQDFLKSIEGATNEGEQIVQRYCANCHAPHPLIPLGAPRLGSLVDWSVRIKKGTKALFKNTNEGFNAMPARGGCFECSDKQLMLAILALLPEAANGGAYFEHKDLTKSK